LIDEDRGTVNSLAVIKNGVDRQNLASFIIVSVFNRTARHVYIIIFIARNIICIAPWFRGSLALAMPRGPRAPCPVPRAPWSP